jgi:hypothetical protein
MIDCWYNVLLLLLPVCDHVFPIGSQGLAPRHWICTIEEYFLTVDLLPTEKKMGNTCVDTWSWTEGEWPWFLWRKHRHLFLVKKNIPRYYIYHKVRNRSIDKQSRSSRFSRFFQLDGRQNGGMAYIICNYDNLSTKWCIKHLPLLNLNNTTDLSPRVSY